MKSIPLLLLVVCIVIGQLSLTTEGADLHWENSVSIVNGHWQFQLLDVPCRNQRKYQSKLYQELPGGELFEIDTTTYRNVPWKQNILFTIPDSYFAHGPKIVKAKVIYPNGDVLESDTFNLDLLFQTVGWIVGCVVGGVCLIVVVVGCILCHKRRRRRVPFQQPVAVMGQSQVYQTSQAPVMVQGQNYQVPQAGTQNQYV